MFGYYASIQMAADRQARRRRQAAGHQLVHAAQAAQHHRSDETRRRGHQVNARPAPRPQDCLPAT